ncbi:MAG TPA: adenylosuccinate synthase [Anaerolineae bacterium]|nr:adenylosuccinate synthase [Anaerolineae bacterium]
MAVNIIVGAQWGDEGKGRVTDLLAAEADVVARYSGGDNAGHTLTVGKDIFKLHLIPSGIVHEGVVCYIGHGVVINPVVLCRELDMLAERGIHVGPERLKIGRGAHLITPAHIALDKARERRRGEGAIGTTERGIGPAYADKSSREGLRASLLDNPEALGDAMVAHLEAKNELLTAVYGVEPLATTEVAAEYAAVAQRLAPYLVENAAFWEDVFERGLKVLAEGAQGTLLDLDHGTYPFVTSSHPTSSGALVGLGLGPKVVERVVGVAKAFTSRVGSGPFPTEVDEESAIRLRGTGSNPWDEFGTTTGRPRRVGWLDLNILRHAVQVNGLTEIAVTKLDILSGLSELPVCVAYELDGKRIHYFPSDLEVVGRCQPIYEKLEGWSEDVTGVRVMSDLPAAARAYIQFIEEKLGVPVTLVSVGPEREQVVR